LNSLASLVTAYPAFAQIRDDLKRELLPTDAVRKKLKEAAAEDEAHGKPMTLKGCVISQKFYRRGTQGVFYIIFQSDIGLMRLQYGMYDSTSTGTDRGPHLWMMKVNAHSPNYANPQSVTQLQPIFDAIIFGASNNRPFELNYTHKSTRGFQDVHTIQILWNETC